MRVLSPILAIVLFCSAPALAVAGPSTAAAPLLLAQAEGPQCTGEACCDLIDSIAADQRAAFRAQHPYCERDDATDDITDNGDDDDDSGDDDDNDDNGGGQP